MLADGRGGGEVVTHLINRGIGHLLRAHAPLAEAGEDLGEMLGYDFARDDKARAAIAGMRHELAAGARPAHALFKLRKGALRELLAKAGEVHRDAAPRVVPALQQLHGLQPRHRGDRQLHAPTARRIETRAAQRGLHARTKARQLRQEAAREEIERRRERIVRAALERDARRAVRQHQRGQHGLEHERGAARRAHGKAIVSRAHALRAEDQLGRADLRAIRHGPANLRRRLHGRKVLPQQTRLRPSRADADNAERLPGDERQRKRGAEDLSPALPG